MNFEGGLEGGGGIEDFSSLLQGRRKIGKSEEAHVNGVGIMCPPPLPRVEIGLTDLYTEDGRSMSVFSLYWQTSQGQIAEFPAFIASKSFDL